MFRTGSYKGLSSDLQQGVRENIESRTFFLCWLHTETSHAFSSSDTHMSASTGACAGTCGRQPSIGSPGQTRTALCSCCARGREGWASTSPPQTPASSLTQTGTPRTTCRYTRTHTHTRTRAHTQSYTHTHTHTHARTHSYTHTRKHIQSYTHTGKHTHTHIQP